MMDYALKNAYGFGQVFTLLHTHTRLSSLPLTGTDCLHISIELFCCMFMLTVTSIVLLVTCHSYSCVSFITMQLPRFIMMIYDE